MKTRIPAFVCILVLYLTLLLTACAPAPVTSPKQSAGAPSAASSPDISMPALTPLPPLSSSSPSPSGTSPSASTKPSTTPKPSPSAAVDAVWTMFVDQTIPKVEDGMTINYHMMLVAQKSGGKDVTGTYKGAAYVGINFDASQMSNSVLQALGGFNVNMATYDLSFDLVGYDVEKYSDFGIQGDLPGLAPLIKYQAMALISPQMTGTGNINTSITGIQGEHGETGDNTTSGSAAVPIKIAIDGASVLLDIPSFQLTHHFEGTLTGTPTGGSSPDSTIQQASDHIKSLMDQAKDAAAAAPSGIPDLGGLLNQFKPN